MTTARRLATLAAFAAFAAPAAAQSRPQSATPVTPPVTRPAAPADRAADERAVIAVLQRMFDAMRTRDTAAMRAVMDSNATLMNTTTGRDGQPVLRVSRIGDFINSIASAPAGLTLDERFYDPEVRIEDHLATVWTKYDFYAGDRISHCGTDAFQLFRSPTGWKVIHITDTMRREGCPIKK